jgi:uncharacterized protein DUF262
MAKKQAAPPVAILAELDQEPTKEGVEGEDDLDQVSSENLRQTVVASADWTAETIVNQLDQGNIDINPAFQRRDAWTGNRKSKFIESLILGLPIPQLVLADNKAKKGTFIVIDGKQRLLSLRQFAAKPGDGYDLLRLSGLEQRKDLVGKSLLDFKADKNLAEDLSSFENQTIRTVVIKNWPNESVLYLIFLRLNTSSVPLSPQELRQALHPGPFLNFVDEKSGQMEGFQKILKLTKPDFRMRDAELMVRYFAFVNFLTRYSGNLKAFLDSTCEDLNKHWGAMHAVIDSQVTGLREAFTTTFDIFGDNNAFRKWDPIEDAYERRFNRAVFDVMTYYFSQPVIRKRTRGQERQIEGDFKKVCENSPEFVRSIETTTKSKEATVSRLNIWGKALNKRLKLHVPVPQIENKQIVLG